MSRWIDADALPRHGQRGGLVHWKDITEAPSIDIVRCQDCKYWVGLIADDDPLDGIDECRWRDDEAPNADDFCSYGERRE